MRRLGLLPEFLGSGMPAVEVEPSVAKNRDRGCVVVRSDGGLFELCVSQTFLAGCPESS